MNENPHEALGKNPFSYQTPKSNPFQSEGTDPFQEDILEDAGEKERLPKKFYWTKGYKKEVQEVMGKIVQTVHENTFLDSCTTPLFETTISMELPEVGTTPLRQALPPPGELLRKIMQEVEYVQQKEEIEEKLNDSELQKPPQTDEFLEEEPSPPFLPMETSEDSTVAVTSSPLEAQEEVKKQEERKETLPPLLETPSAPRSEPKLAFLSRRFPRLMKEMVLGLVLGVVFLAGFSFFRTPMEERFRESLRGEIFSEVVYQPSEKSSLPGVIDWKDVEWTPATGVEPDRTILAERLEAEMEPLSLVYDSPRVKRLTLQGVRFPLLQTLPETGRTTTAESELSTNNDDLLREKMASLQSLAWIEEVKGRYLPSFEEMSTRLEALEKEATEIRTAMEPLLRQGSDPTPEAAGKLERLAEIRKESDELQQQWKAVSTEVTQALGKVGEKVAMDGKDLSKILQNNDGNREKLATLLYTPETSSQLHQFLVAGQALESLIQMAAWSGEIPPQTLETSGEIELCGQIFHFSGDWNTETREDCLRSFYGTMELREKGEKEENPAVGSWMLSCRQKKNLLQRHFSARIPLGTGAICLGSLSEERGLTSTSREGLLEVELDLYDNEIQGTMRFTRNGLKWQGKEPCSTALETAFIRWSADSLTWEATVSGTLDKPVFHYTETATETLLPIYAEAIQESSRQKRSALVKQIYGKLKNAETMFNSAMEPYYQKMASATEKIMKTHEHLAASVIPPSTVAPVIIAEIRLDTSEESIEGEIPMFDPTLGVVEEPATAVGTQVAVPSSTRFVPVKKVEIITPPEEKTAATPNPPEKKNAALEIMPMEATFFANSTPQAVETPLVTSEMAAPHGPLPLPMGEIPSGQNTGTIPPVRPAVPVVKPAPMPVPVMRSTTQFGG